jgi:hypothetical protein
VERNKEMSTDRAYIKGALNGMRLEQRRIREANAGNFCGTLALMDIMRAEEEFISKIVGYFRGE